VEISETATGRQATGVTDGRSLWDKAYDSLKTDEHDRIAAYEDLLSRVPTGGKIGSC
jgi:DNA/RNA-binding domain of Phe-tRNA-synthetase-like protein